MKIQAIRALVKAAQWCVLYTSQKGGQWIGTRDAMFRVDNGLCLAHDKVPGLLVLDEQEQKKITFFKERLEDAEIYPVPRVDLNQMTDMGFEILCGKQLLPLRCVAKTYLVDLKMVRAAVDDEDYRYFYLVRNRWGAPLIAVYDGMIQQGVIKPEPMKAVETVMKLLREISFGETDGWREEEPSQSPDGASVSHEGEALGEQMTMEDADV